MVSHLFSHYQEAKIRTIHHLNRIHRVQITTMPKATLVLRQVQMQIQVEAPPTIREVEVSKGPKER